MKKLKSKQNDIETRVWVTRTITKSGDVLGGEDASEQIAVKTFRTEPAFVKLEKTLPIQLAKFLIGKVSVSITLPCYVEEIETAKEALPKMVDEFLTEELKTLPDLLREIEDG